MSPIIDPQQIEHWDVHEGVEAALVAAGENMTGLMCWWPPGASFHTHTHPHEQIGSVMQGTAIFTIDGVEHQVGPGLTSVKELATAIWGLSRSAGR